MERIRCPHCNAVNQDVAPTDACWQCGKPLSAAAPVAVATADAAPGEASSTGWPLLEVQQPVVPTPAGPNKAQNTPTLEERVAARKAARKSGNRAVPSIMIAVIAVILIVLLVLFLLSRHR